MRNIAIFIFVGLLFTSNVNAGKTLYQSSETIDTTQNENVLYLAIPFNFEMNDGSMYQINFTNLPSSQSEVSVEYSEQSSKLISSNMQPNNESAYLLASGEELVLSYEKEGCELDTEIVRGGIIKLVNGTSASVDILAKVTKDKGECGGDGFISFPFIPMIFTIWVVAVIIKNKKSHKT